MWLMITRSMLAPSTYPEAVMEFLLERYAEVGA
jgi:hypothetical protein